MSDPLEFVAGAALTGGGILVSGASFGLASPLGAAMIGEGIGLAVGGLLPGRSPDSSMSGGNVASSDAPLPVVYGETMLRANLADFRQDPGSSGKKFHGVPIALCVASEDGGGIESVPTVYFDGDVAISSPTVGADQHANGVQSHWSGKLEYGLQLGGDSVVVPTPMNARWPANWPATSKPTGVATLSLYIDFDKDVFTTGFPKVQILVRGNHVYDPRDGTWKYSTNAWLAVLDYLTSQRYGYGAPYPQRDGGTARSRINEQSFIDMANYADEAVQDGSGGTQKRFEIGGWLDTSNDYRTNLEALLSACRGAIVFQDGQIRAYTPGAASVSSVGFDESDFVGAVTYRRQGKVPQHITGRYPDASYRYQTLSVDWPTADPNPYLDNDGGLVRETEMRLPMTTNAVRAQQILMTALKERRFDKVVSGTVTEKALQEQVGSVVPVSLEHLSWSDKPMRIANLRYRSDFLVDIVFQEYNAAAYSLDPQSAPGSIPDNELPDVRSIAAPTNLSATSGSLEQIMLAGGANVPGIRATWTVSDGPFLWGTRVLARKQGAATWAFKSGIVDGATDQELVFPPPAGLEGDTWEVAAEAISTLGLISARVSTTVRLTTSYRPNLGPFPIGRHPQIDQGFGGADPANPKMYSHVMSDDGLTKLVDAVTRKIQTGLLAQDGNAVEDRISHTRGDGTLDSGTSQYDGTASLGLGAGFETGLAADGDAPRFSMARGAVPKVRFYPAGGIMNDGSGTVSGNYGPVFIPQNVSPSGFDAFLKLRETAGTTTSVSIASWSTAGTHDLEAAKSATAEAYNDQYDLSHHLFIAGGTLGGSCFGRTGTVGYYYKKPGGSWVQEASQQFSSDCDDFDADVSHSMVVDGMGSGADFAVNVDSGTGTVSDPSSGNAVEWSTASAPTQVGATPSGAQPVPWLASKT